MLYRDQIARIFYKIEDKLFDFLAHINTKGVIPASQLESLSDYKTHATAYHAVWCRNIRKLINMSRKMGHNPKTFIDVGCGMGKACFYASRFNFDQIVGFDFDESLIRRAKANLELFRYPKSAIDFMVADATEYLIPLSGGMIFMFNPFDATVMKIFLENNKTRFISSDSILAYANDCERETLAKAGMQQIFREADRSLSIWKFP